MWQLRRGQIAGRGPLDATAATSYQGPGDIVGSAFAWYGLRGYNAAYATGSNPAIDLVDQAGANPLTVNILSNGRLDVASISSWVTANSVSTIKVTKLYDQSGNSRHILQATLANMPVLNLTGFGSLPAIVYVGANSERLQTSGTYSLAQPITISAVYNHTASASTTEVMGFLNRPIIAHTGSNLTRGLNPTTSLASQTKADGSWNTVHAVNDGASSAFYVDATQLVTGTTAGGASSKAIGLGMNAFSNFPTMSAAEFGIWGVAFNSTQAGDINTNQHGSNGYNF